MSPEMRKELSFLKGMYIDARNNGVDWMMKLSADLQADLIEWVKAERPLIEQAPM